MTNYETFGSYIFIAQAIGLLLTILIAPFILSRYRKAILKGMNTSGDQQEKPDKTLHSKISQATSNLKFEILHEGTLQVSSRNKISKANVVYLLSTLVFVIISTLGLIFLDEQTTFNLKVLVLLGSSFMLPFLLYYILRLTLHPVLLTCIALIGYLMISYLTIGLKVLPIYGMAVIPFLIFFLLNIGNKRAISPYLYAILAGSIACIPVFFFIFQHIISPVHDQFSDNQLLLSLLVLAAMLIWIYFLLSKRGLKTISGWYTKKQMSDWSIECDTLLLIITLWNFSIYINYYQSLWAFIPLLAFFAYKITFRLVSSFQFSEKTNQKETNLLFLRVFGFQNRTEKFFRNLSFHWRKNGSIHLIAAPDLAANLIEPHELFDFFAGNLEKQYIKNDLDLARKMLTMDTKPDPDGRYRINEYFCYNNIWKETLKTLLPYSNVIIMDLRSFSESKKGCIYEIKQLLYQVPLSRILFVIDHSTNFNFLQATLINLHRSLPPSSPNSKKDTGKVQLFQVKKGGTKEVQKLGTYLIEKKV